MASTMSLFADLHINSPAQLLDDMDLIYTQPYDDSSMYAQSLIYGLHEDGFLPLLHSEPLVRHGSSDGSSYTSSTPASPMPRSSPYLSCLDVATPESASLGSPETRMEDLVRPSGRDYPVCCLHPGCDAKPFKRRADLDRHYKHKHAPDSLKDSYHCDYPRCGRRRDPFHRRDHFRDHLRDFHKEDIEKRGVSATSSPRLDGSEGRSSAQSWWRCTKCLKRISITRYAYECPTCKTSCQRRRR